MSHVFAPCIAGFVTATKDVDTKAENVKSKRSPGVRLSPQANPANRYKPKNTPRPAVSQRVLKLLTSPDRRVKRRKGSLFFIFFLLSFCSTLHTHARMLFKAQTDTPDGLSIERKRATPIKTQHQDSRYRQVVRFASV